MYRTVADVGGGEEKSQARKRIERDRERERERERERKGVSTKQRLLSSYMHIIESHIWQS